MKNYKNRDYGKKENSIKHKNNKKQINELGGGGKVRKLLLPN
jgi:hypothetical protein